MAADVSSVIAPLLYLLAHQFMSTQVFATVLMKFSMLTVLLYVCVCFACFLPHFNSGQKLRVSIKLAYRLWCFIF